MVINWLIKAKQENFSYILILLDLDDREMYPVFFKTKEELYAYKNNILSEMKVKEVETIVV